MSNGNGLEVATLTLDLLLTDLFESIVFVGPARHVFGPNEN